MLQSSCCWYKVCAWFVLKYRIQIEPATPRPNNKMYSKTQSNFPDPIVVNLSDQQFSCRHNRICTQECIVFFHFTTQVNQSKQTHTTHQCSFLYPLLLLASFSFSLFPSFVQNSIKLCASGDVIPDKVYFLCTTTI